MITTFDIGEVLYPVINVATVKAVIDGAVYRNKKPLNSELQDIVILPLSNYSGDEIFNESVFMVNIYCKNFLNGTPDITNLSAIAEKVIAVIEAYNSTTHYYIFKILNQLTLQDMDQKKMTYVNLRIECTIEN